MKNRVIQPTYLYALFVPINKLLICFFLMILIYVFPLYSFLFKIGAGIYFFIFLYRFILIKTYRYEINKEQIVFTRGIFSIRTDFLELYRVKDFKIYRSFLMRVISVMKVTLITSDKSNRIFDLAGVPKSNLAHHIRELVELNRSEKRVYEID